MAFQENLNASSRIKILNVNTCCFDQHENVKYT